MRTEIGCVESKVGQIMSVCMHMRYAIYHCNKSPALPQFFPPVVVWSMNLFDYEHTEGRWRSVLQYANVCLNICKYSLCMHMRFHVPAEIILSK